LPRDVFLLVSGDTFRRKVVSAGPFARKRITIEALDEITGQIQRYLFVQLLLSTIVGVATWQHFCGSVSSTRPSRGFLRQVQI
jgi:predicted PurR-regulated permease PerM